MAAQAGANKMNWADQDDDHDHSHAASAAQPDDGHADQQYDDQAGHGDQHDQGHGHGQDHGHAPRAPAEVPDRPPFKAFVGNLDFSVTENDLADFFKDTQIKDIRLIYDKATQKFKGFGYMEFADRDSLVYALEADGHPFVGDRPIKVDVATDRQREQRGDRGGGRGGFRNDRGGGRRQGSGRGNFDEPDHGGYGARGVRRVKQDDFDAPPADADPSKARPKLQLAKRSVASPVNAVAPAAAPASAAAAAPAAAAAAAPSDATPTAAKKKSNPFGDARPRELVLQERGQKPGNVSPPSTSPALKPAAAPAPAGRGKPHGGPSPSNQQHQGQQGHGNAPQQRQGSGRGARQQHDNSWGPSANSKPRSAERKKAPAPQVDDQGFTNVQSKKPTKKKGSGAVLSPAGPTGASGADVSPAASSDPKKKPADDATDAQAPSNQFDALSLEDDGPQDNGDDAADS